MNRFQFHRIGVADQQASSRLSLQDCLQAVLPAADLLMRDVLDGLSGVSGRKRFNGALACPTPISWEMTDVLCGQTPLVVQTFVAQLELSVYSGGVQDSSDRPTSGFDDLKLIIGDQIDGSLERALALQEVSHCVDDVMPSVDALVSSLAGWTTVQPLLNPLKAEVFANALLVCLHRYAPDPKVRAALLMPCAGLLGVGLREFYQEICSWLRSLGIEPSRPAGMSTVAGSSASEEGTKNSTSRTMAILDKFRNLLSGKAEWSTRGQDFLPTVPYSYDALEELKLIKPMMQRLTERGSQYVEVAVTEDLAALGDTQGQSQAKRLSRQLGQEVVRLMLDSQLNDDRLQPAVAVLIRSLEPVLLRLAQSDPRFFSDRQHPARQLLEWIVRRSLAYRSEAEPDFCRFLAALSQAVNVLTGPDLGAALFATVLHRLQDDWKLDESTPIAMDDFGQGRLNERSFKPADGLLRTDLS